MSANPTVTNEDGWSRIIDKIIRGDRFEKPFVRLGRTPDLLKEFGCAPVDLVMSPGKIRRCRKEHPEVLLEQWRRLPTLIGDPLAIIPSARRDASMVLILTVIDYDGCPVLVVIMPGSEHAPNTVLSVYGKDRGHAWIETEIARASNEGLPTFLKKDFAATMPQPESASKDAIPSSSGLIPVDGTAKPGREILTILRKVKD